MNDDKPIDDLVPTDPPLDIHALAAGRAVLKATITVTRKATGKVEHYELTGTPVLDEPPADDANDNGS